MSLDQDSAINVGQDLVPWKWSYQRNLPLPRWTPTEERIDLEESLFDPPIEFPSEQLRLSEVNGVIGVLEDFTISQGGTYDWTIREPDIVEPVRTQMPESEENLIVS